MNLKAIAVFLVVLVARGGANASQKPGKDPKWHDHYSFTNAKKVIILGNKVYCVCSNAVSCYDISTGEVSRLTKSNALSDVATSAIVGDPRTGILIIGYENGNVDIISDSIFKNVPEYKSSLLNVDKKINDIKIIDGKAFLCSGAGVLVLDYKRGYFLEKYSLGSSEKSIGVNNIAYEPMQSRLYVTTNEGVFSALYGTLNLSDFNNWKKVKTLGSGKFSSICTFNNKIFVSNLIGSTQYKIIAFDDTSSKPFTDTLNHVNNITSSNDYLVITTQSDICIYNKHYQLVKKISKDEVPSPLFKDAILDGNGTCWIATGNNGLINSKDYSSLSPNGPIDDRVSAIDYSNYNLFISCGVLWSNTMSMSSMYSFGTSHWSNSKNQYSSEATIVAAHPIREQEYVVGNFLSGIYGVNFGMGMIYTVVDNNTFRHKSKPYSNISGLKYDKKGNLFIYDDDDTLYVYSNDGKLHAQGYTNFPIKRLDFLNIDKNNIKWLSFGKASSAIIAIDDNNTFDNPKDDRIASLDAKDNKGESVGLFSTCSVVDKTDVLWVGTNTGLSYYQNASNIFNDNAPVLSRNHVNIDGVVDYLLATEYIKCIDVDASNRKWVGTNNGVFVVSPDGLKVEMHFTTHNSPLPSNFISSLKVVSEKKTVFVGTLQGLASYDIEVTIPREDLQNVAVFPNPVNHSYDDIIRIDGLTEKTTVVITDISGNLVFRTVSQGGMTFWDKKNREGNPTVPGVYFVTCLSEDESMKRVIKLVIE